MSPPDLTPRPTSPAAPKRQLTLFDSTSIIMGIIIGAGIYRSSPDIARAASGLAEKLCEHSPMVANWAEHSRLVAWCLSDSQVLIGLWLLGGLLSLIGAFCYAELATAYPKEGGDYVYLTRAFGRSPGFLFAWAQFWVIRPGSIGGLAYVFASYANQLLPLFRGQYEHVSLILYAAASVAVLTAINVLGVREAKWTQNLLTMVKVLGPVAIFAVGMWFTSPAKDAQTISPGFGQASFYYAMIFILWTYGGWNEMAYVGAEVRNPHKNILRALVLGTVTVTLIYVLINVAFIHALGVAGTANSKTVAADVFALAFGKSGARLISLLICISCLGAINGNIFTGARITYAMGKEHRLFAALGRWSGRLGTPVWSLAVQAVIAVVLVVGFGLTRSGFESMVQFTTPIFWGFFLLAGISLFVLRFREPDTVRPYRVPLYPLIPILFCLSSMFMLYASLEYALTCGKYEPIWAVAIVLVGVGFCFYDPPPKAPQGPPPETPDAD